MPKNRVVVNNKGVVDLNESEGCFLPGKDRDQLILYAKIGSVSPYLLKDHKPIIYEALNKYLTENHPDYLVSIYPEGYDFALVYDEHCEEDGEKDKAFTLFLGKKGFKGEDNVAITLDTISDIKDVEETNEVIVYKEEPGNLRETIVAQSTIMAQKKLHRDPHILD